MSVAKVVEINASSTESFDDAVRRGIAKASESLNHIRSAWIKEQKVDVSEGDLTQFRVDMYVTFLLDESESVAGAGGAD